jgi:transcriptional regulator with XRE-family HTH domain
MIILVLVSCMNRHSFSEAALIGNHIRYMRRVKDVTQEELAELIDVSVGWISRVERGANLPNLKLLFRIAKALRVQVRELLPL